MNDILGSPFFYTGLTLLCHILSIYIYKKTKLHYILPILISMVLLIAVLKISGIEYKDYMTGGSMILFLWVLQQYPCLYLFTDR